MSQSISDVAKLYNVSINTIGYHMKRNELEFEYIGGKRFISDEHIKQLSNYINVQHTSNESSNDNKNTTTESNNDDEYIQHLKDEVVYLRESLKHNQQLLDQQQQLTQSSNKKVSKLENKIEEYKYKLEDSNSVAVSTDTKRVLKVKNRKKVNSNNVDDTYTYEDAHTRPTDESDTNEDNNTTDQATESTDTHTDIKESTDTNVEDVKENNVKSNKRTWLDKLLGLNK